MRQLKRKIEAAAQTMQRARSRLRPLAPLFTIYVRDGNAPTVQAPLIKFLCEIRMLQKIA